MESTINPQATSLQVFYNENEDVSIRTEMKDGEPWFVAKDIASALDIVWTGHTLDRIPEEWKTMVSFTVYASEDAVTRVRRTALINESAMYKLAFRSNKPEADRFVNWIAGSVLPSIRRMGSYSSDGAQPPVKENKKLPLPKFRPHYQDWKNKISSYISKKELNTVAYAMNLTLSHVRKVYLGTCMSGRVARALTTIARQNRCAGVTYPTIYPVYEQLSLEWEEEERKNGVLNDPTTL